MKISKYFVSSVLIALPAVASTINVVGSDAEIIAFGGVRYKLQTNRSGTISSPPTGFLGGSTAVSSSANGIVYSGYGVPGGATLSGATLDFSGVFSGSLITFSVQSPPNSFTNSPAFSDSLGTYVVTISSVLGGTAIVNSLAGTNFDLAPQFGADLLANNPISVLWTATATFSALNPASPGCSNCNEIFNVSDSRSFMASNTANRLSISYDLPPTATETPEPVSMILAGVGLVAVGIWKRRLKSRID